MAGTERASWEGFLGRRLAAAALTSLVLAPLLWPVITDWTSAAASPAPSDFPLFGPAGAALLTGHASGVYADRNIQAGPFELAVFGVLRLLGIESRIGWTVALMVLCALSVFVLALVLRPGRGPGIRTAVLAAGGAGVLCIVEAVPQAWLSAHPAELAIPVLWILAGRVAARGRPASAAALVAGATGFETWALLGLPVVLLAAHPFRLRVAIAAAAPLAILWTPFLLLGAFRMGAYTWQIAPGSIWSLALPAGADFPWSLRLLQAACATLAGAAAATLARRSAPATGPWVVPLALVGARLLLDPNPIAGYYWDPLMIAAVGLLVIGADRRDPVVTVAALGALAAAAVPGAPLLRAGLIVALACGTPIAATWAAGRLAPGPRALQQADSPSAGSRACREPAEPKTAC